MMKALPSFRLALAWLLLMGGPAVCLRAQSALCVVRNGETCVVLKVARGYAYIMEGDKMIPIRPSQSGLVPVEEFYPVFVAVRGLNAKSSTMSLSGGGSNINNEFHFAATFESGYVLKEAFLVLELDMENGKKRIFYQEIGNLLPGKPQWVNVAVPLAEELGSGKFQLHVFTEGREVFNSLQPWEFREGVLNQMVRKRLEGVKEARPEPLVGPVPEYPEALRKKKVKGEAVVAVRITRTGVVADPEVVRATDPAFGEAALVAVRQWRFLPQVKAGQPVETHVNIPFHFEAPAADGKS
jgi:TonB family protein